MEKSLLDRLAAEAALLCHGGVVRSLLPRPGLGFALLFEERGRAALDLAPGPPRSRLAATSLRLKSSDGPGPRAFAVLEAALLGRRLTGVAILAGERIVRLEFDSGESVRLEVLGPAANLFLTDAGGRVRLRVRRAPRPGGELVEGRIWRPPAAKPGAEPENRATEVWDQVVAQSVPAPGLAAPCRLEEADPLRSLTPGALEARSGGPRSDREVWLPTLSLGDAVTLRDAWLSRQEDASRRRQEVGGWLRAERRRLARLDAKLLQEEEAASRHPELRRQAEAILAGLRRTRRQGDRLFVSDPYAEAEQLLEIPIDPAKSDEANAEILFRRAGRLSRALEHVGRKRAVVAERSRRLEAVEGAFTALASLSELESLEALLEAGRPHERGRGKPVPRSTRPAGQEGRKKRRTAMEARLRSFDLEGGWRILVGGSGEENDVLTFRVASPHDFWLHAADYPGAHVVVRNAGRRPEPPPVILRQAAEIAAHFSKAPRGELTDVRWTQARHLRKPRGLPPGRVLLSRFSSIAVRPGLPPRPDPYAMP